MSTKTAVATATQAAVAVSPTGSKRAARRDVESAFTPVAQALNLRFEAGEQPNLIEGTTYLEGFKKGAFRAVTVTADGGSSPVLAGLAPLPASELVNVYNAVSAILPKLKSLVTK